MPADHSRALTASRLRPGDRIYAIGDIHGEAALFEQLLTQIRDDNAERGPANVTLLLLGDLIARGREAAALLRTVATLDHRQLVVLKGNHEAAFVDSYRGNREALDFWMRFGGRSTMVGFGIGEEELATQDGASLLTMLQAKVDPALIDWLDARPTSWPAGDYFFVHAGIKPGVRLESQNDNDFLWIREPFLSSRKTHEKIVVHGHTIETGVPPLGGTRIGLDTGAHEHGVLTALGLEGGRQWLLQAEQSADEAAVRHAARVMSAPQRPVGEIEQARLSRAIHRLVDDIIACAHPDAVPLLLTEERVFPPAAVTEKSEKIAKKQRTQTIIAMLCGAIVLLASSALVWTLSRPTIRPDSRPRITADLPAPTRATVPQPAQIALPAIPQRIAVSAPPMPARTVAAAVHRRAAWTRSRHSFAPVRSTYAAWNQRRTEADARSATSQMSAAAALDKALADDRMATRRLNKIEIDNINRIKSLERNTASRSKCSNRLFSRHRCS
jgi:serine/threonine protein phosphatase 1